jgi:hypothetical protein
MSIADVETDRVVGKSACGCDINCFASGSLAIGKGADSKHNQ